MIRAIAQELLLRALEETGVLAHLDLLDQLRRAANVTPIQDPATDFDRKWNDFSALHMRPAPQRPRRLWLGVPRLGWEPGLRLRGRRVITWRIESSTGPDRWSVAIGRLLLMFGPQKDPQKDGPQRQEAELHLHDSYMPSLPLGPPTQGADQWSCVARGCIDRLEDAADRAYGRYARAVGSVAVGGGRMPVVPNARVRRAWVEAIRGALGLPPGVKPGELAPPPDLTTIEAAALAAYERYGDACGWRTVGGGQMPRWADQHERLRLCWREAARGALGLQPGVNPGDLAPATPVILPTSPSLAGGAG